MSERTTEQIEDELEAAKAELRALENLPTKFTKGGDTVDNTERIIILRDRVLILRKELIGESPFQGPNLQV